MKFGCHTANADFGPNPYVANIQEMTLKNRNFRTAIWTGCHLQMTLMCIPPYGEIGPEIHPETDQYIRVEQGKAVVIMGENKYCMEYEENMYLGDAVFIPAGTWHNVVNTGVCPLKVSVMYAPPNHPQGTVHQTKEDAEEDEY